MSRRRSVATLLFRTARRLDDIETLASGNPKRIERRVKNKVVGRGARKGRLLAVLVEMRA